MTEANCYDAGYDAGYDACLSQAMGILAEALASALVRLADSGGDDKSLWRDQFRVASEVLKGGAVHLSRTASTLCGCNHTEDTPTMPPNMNLVTCFKCWSKIAETA